jgi:hypothetical protein
MEAVEDRELREFVAGRIMGWHCDDKGIWHSPRINGVMSHGDPPDYPNDPTADYEVLRHVIDTWLFSKRLAFFEALDTILQSRAVTPSHVSGLWALTYLQPGDFARAAKAVMEWVAGNLKGGMKT